MACFSTGSLWGFCCSFLCLLLFSTWSMWTPWARNFTVCKKLLYCWFCLLWAFRNSICYHSLHYTIGQVSFCSKSAWATNDMIFILFHLHAQTESFVLSVYFVIILSVHRFFLALIYHWRFLPLDRYAKYNKYTVDLHYCILVV